ncbi:MAG: hypothetical protein LIO85_05285 [Rikenellaceae bacterium]|nr:hypothetical protein [Rikenellaceae bacterium]
MKRIAIIISTVTLAVATAGCSDSDGNGPVVKATVSAAGGESSSTEIYVWPGTDVEYRFTVSSTVKLRTVELHRRIGSGVNAQEPTRIERIDLRESESYTYEISGTVEDIGDDYQYSLYAEDIDGNYTSVRVCAWLDVTRYSQTLMDGRKDATSKTFLNLASGTTYYIANTIADPAGMDLGFTYMEGSRYGACLVSFDEYYKTGNYGMVVNDAAPWVEFRDVSHIADAALWFDGNAGSGRLEEYFERGVEYDRILDYSARKIAHTLWESDILALRTRNGCYGLLKVDAIDRRDESELNNQTIDFSVVITRNR